SDRDIALTERRQQVDALLHLRRRALGERDGEDLLWARAARRDQVGDAASEHAGLARPRARHDEERPVAVSDRLALRFRQVRERIARDLQRIARSADQLELIRTSVHHYLLLTSPDPSLRDARIARHATPAA